MKKFIKKLTIFGMFLTTIIFIWCFCQRNDILTITNSISLDTRYYVMKNLDMEHLDIAAVGSSMTLYQLDGDIFMSTQNEDCSFYNVSAWGLQLVDDYELIKYIVERYSPNEIIIFGNLIDFVEGPSTQTNIDKAKDYLDDIFFNDIKLILDYGFPNNISTKKEYLDRHFAPTELNEDLRYDEWGGVLLDVYGDDILKVRYDECLTTSPQDCQYDALEKIAQYLYERNIKLYYVQTPVRKHYLSEEGAEDKMLRHCEKCRMIVENNGGYYVNFLNFQKYTDEYFADCIHLNKDGAQMLTREFVKWYSEIE